MFSVKHGFGESPMRTQTGMRLIDAQGQRLYVTASEREAVRQAAAHAPGEVRTYCWTLL